MNFLSSAVKKIAVLGIISELGYLAIWMFRYCHFPAESSYDLLKNNHNFAIVLAIFLILFAVYIIASIGKNLEHVSNRLIFGFAIIFNLTLFVVFPIASDDVLSYISEGRIISQHNGNPYTDVLDDFQKNDLLYSKIKTVWSGTPSDYGPLFLMIETAITFFGSNNFFINVYLFKALFVILNLIIGWFVYKITKSNLALLLYSWNPLILFEISLNAHNDILLVFLLVLSLYYLHRNLKFRNHLVAWMLIVLSVLTKYYKVILIPFYMLFTLKISEKWLTRFKYACMFFLTGLFLTVVLFYPYWLSLEILESPLSLYKERGISPSLGIIIIDGLISIFSAGGNYDLARKIALVIFSGIYFYLIFYLLRLKKPVFENNLYVLTIVFWAFIFLNLNFIKPNYLTPGILLLTVSSGGNKNTKQYLLSTFTATLYAFFLYFLVR